METTIRQSSAMPKKINTPFGYFGSKNKIALKLCTDLPPHNCWVEAFCGSAALTLRKEPAQIEVINDIDSEIYNFFEQLRKNTAALIEAVKLTPYAEQELRSSRIPEENLSELERARRFLVQSMMSINGVFGEERSGFSYSDSFTRNGQDARVSRWNNMPKRLEQVVERLKKVRVENKDAFKLLKRYVNRPNTLVYLDPPYLGQRTSGYNNDANDVDFHTRLLKLANTANCMIFISAYEHPLYEALLTDGWWCKRTIETSTKGSNGKTRARTEVVWMNKHYMNALNEGQLPLELSQKERAEGRCNPEVRHAKKEESSDRESVRNNNQKPNTMYRFELFKSDVNHEFYFRFKSNEIQLLNSEGYTSKNGCMNGMESVRKNAPIDARYDRKDGDHFTFNLKAANGEIIARSSKLYKTRPEREKAIEKVKSGAPEASWKDLT